MEAQKTWSVGGARRLFRGRSAVGAAEDDAARRLDEEVALRVLGYQWVRWSTHDGASPPSDETGRFLAPMDGLLSHHQVPADSGVPLAREPYRYVPQFSGEIESALEAANAVGLFRDAKASLEVSEEGHWTVRTKGDRLAVAAPTLPEALCRAALRWKEIEEAVRLAVKAG